MGNIQDSPRRGSSKSPRIFQKQGFEHRSKGLCQVVKEATDVLLLEYRRRDPIPLHVLIGPIFFRPNIEYVQLNPNGDYKRGHPDK